MTPLSLKNASKDMGLCKNKNKRCIPKEGMPHAQACKKEVEKKIAPIQIKLVDISEIQNDKPMYCE